MITTVLCYSATYVAMLLFTTHLWIWDVGQQVYREHVSDLHLP